jgi:hypothetical protein
MAVMVKMMWDFAAGAQELHAETGLAYGESARLQGVIKSTSMEMTGLGVSSEEVKEAAMGIADHWGGFGEVTKENVKSLAMLQTEFGISGTTAADLANQMSAVGAGSKEAAIEQLKSVSALSQANGVAPAQIMEEVAQNSELFSQFAQDGGKNVFKAAIQAKKLGVSMDTVASSADALLEFETSIESQMEASMLLGRNINTDKARQLAFEGDLAGMQKEILKQAGSEAEWNKLNVVQRKAMADAFGLTTDEMGRMIGNQSKLDKMSTAEVNAMEMKEELIQKLKKAWTNIMSALTKMWPIIVGFVSPLLLVLGALGGILLFVGKIAGWLGEFGVIGNVILGLIGAWVSWSLLFGKSLMGPIKSMGRMLAFLSQKLGLSKLINLEAIKNNTIVQKGLKFAGKAKEGVMKRVDEIKGKVTGKAKDAIDADGTPTPDKTKKATKKRKGKKGKGGKGGMGFMEKIDGKKMIQGAAALLIAAAALWVAAKALQEFAKVTWESIAMAGVTLLGLTLVLAILGKLQGQLVQGAVAMLIMSVALIPFAFALQMFTGIDFAQVALGGVAMIGFAVAMGLLGFAAPFIIAGAAAVAIMGIALIPFAVALRLFTGIDFEQVKLGGIAMMGLGVALAGLGFMAPLIMAGSYALGIMSIALLGFGAALILVGLGMKSIQGTFSSIVEPLTQLASIVSPLLLLAGAFTALGMSMGVMAIGALALLPALPVLMTLAALGMLGGSVLGGGEGAATGGAEANPVELKLETTNAKLDTLIGLMSEDGFMVENLKGIKKNTGTFAGSVI